MAEYLIKGETLESMADKIRILDGIEGALTTAQMDGKLGEVNTEIGEQAELLAQAVAALEGKAAGEQATPEISVSSNGLITATAGAKTSTHQLAFQAAKTVTPSTASQIAVSSGYYTGGNVTVAAVPTQSKTVTPKATAQNITPDSGKFLSKVTINGDSNLVAGNIKSGVSIFGVSGTLVEGGTSSEEQGDIFITRAISGSYFNNRVTTIGGGALAGCTGLTEVNFPACITISATSVTGNFPDVGAFQYCTNLTTVDFPACTSIGINAFYKCSNLTTVSFPVATRIDSSAFQYCTKLTVVDFPACTSIGSNAFYDCSNLTTVSFPVATRIDSSAFQYCTKLTTVDFPAATSIGDYAFGYCSNLTTVSFPVCTNIGRNAFHKCSNLTTVSFPVVTRIDISAFYECTNLTTVDFPAATSIGAYAFISCRKLTTVDFPACTNIEYSAFTSCSNLTTVSFPACISVGYSAFASCFKLATANFPAVTRIGMNAFNRCYNLKSLYLTGSSICTLSNSNAFSSTPYAGYSASFSGTPYIYVPSSLVDSYKTATNWTYFSKYFSAIEVSGGDERPEIITFTIDGIEFQAEEDMTWIEWVETDYNTCEAYISEYNFVFVSTSVSMEDSCLHDDGFNEPISANAVIIENYSYVSG